MGLATSVCCVSQMHVHAACRTDHEVVVSHVEEYELVQKNVSEGSL